MPPFGKNNFYSMQYRIAFKVKVKHWNCAHYCSERGARAAIMQAFSMRDFNFKSNSIVIFLYVLENLSSFNQVFFPRCVNFFLKNMQFFLKSMQFFLKNMQFFSKICQMPHFTICPRNWSQFQMLRPLDYFLGSFSRTLFWCFPDS